MLKLAAAAAAAAAVAAAPPHAAASSGAPVSGSQATESFTCPTYSAIRDPSVAASAFAVDEFAGSWYMVATTEPTLPTFCMCGVNDVFVDTAAASYNYTNTDYCDHLDSNITVHIRGKLSPDPSSPGGWVGGCGE